MNSKQHIIDQTYNKSLELLRNLSTPFGFTASTQDTANYKRVWSRDGIISGIASLASEDNKLIETYKKTLETLRNYQDKTGRIPSNVAPEEGKISYGTSVGRVDATLWYVIGVCQYSLKTGDTDLFENYKDSLEKALFYLSCLELNGKDLVYIPQGGDWADEYINHGYVLFDELLYYIGLSSYCKLADNPDIAAKRDTVRKRIAVNYFPNEKNLENEFVYNRTVFEGSLREYNPPLPVAFFTSNTVNFRVDNFANALLFATNIIDENHKKEIFSTIMHRCYSPECSILPAFYPVIEEGDHDWDELRKNYLFYFRNEPHEYHNGGLWPLVHGFVLAGYRQENNSEYLREFAERLAKDDYIFPEYYHGLTLKPEGTPHLGFSSSAYILAYKNIVDNTPPFDI